MRVRLLIDTVVSEDEIFALAELIAVQPPATLSIQANDNGLDRILGGRFVGAQQLYGGDS